MLGGNLIHGFFTLVAMVAVVVEVLIVVVVVLVIIVAVVIMVLNRMTPSLDDSMTLFAFIALITFCLLIGCHGSDQDGSFHSNNPIPFFPK